MITRLLSVSLLAGLIAGALVAGLQHVTTTPLILAAEVYEKAADTKKEAAAPALLHRAVLSSQANVILVHGDAGHENSATAASASEWEPADGLERTLATSTSTIGTAVGFSLILLAGMIAAGDRIDERRAMAWAAAGFVVTGLAPSLGLAPELPGMAAAELAGRQAWWLMTAAATAAALWIFLRNDNPLLRTSALALLIVPHVFGAPHPHELATSEVPAELSARFAATSLAVHAALWMATGFFAGLVWRKFYARAPLIEGAHSA